MQEETLKYWSIKRYYYLTLFCSIFFMACNSEHPQKTVHSSNPEIEEILENYYSTMSARDWPAYKKFFSSDAALTTVWLKEPDTIPKIISTSIDDFIAQTKDGPDSQPIFEEKMLSSEITQKKNLANAWVRYEAKFGTADNLMEWKGHDLFSFIKYDHEWKIVSIVFESE